MAFDVDLTNEYRRLAQEQTDALVKRNEELAELKAERDKLAAELSTLRAQQAVSKEFGGRDPKDLGPIDLMRYGRQLGEERAREQEARHPQPAAVDISTLSSAEMLRMGRPGALAARARDKSGRKS
jgi:hypothetical protein